MTQKDRILKHLETYKSISGLEAINLYTITDLAGVVRDLKALGYQITSTWITTTNRLGETKRYKRYMLTK